MEAPGSREASQSRAFAAAWASVTVKAAPVFQFWPIIPCQLSVQSDWPVVRPWPATAPVVPLTMTTPTVLPFKVTVNLQPIGTVDVPGV
ncbi:MAG: hypothetical protein IPO93_07160 [Actinobacteria bacterium]|nr:hypothetical protein [Actinomycetota bacterium]